jgi:hypothetical protein
MPKPICVKCKRFFKPYRNGIRALEQMPLTRDARPGAEDEDQWTPYKIWVGDLLRCDGCGTEIVSGYGGRPLCEHYQADFAVPPGAIIVNDC